MEKEIALIEEAVTGNHRSFEKLVSPYRNGMLSIAYRMCGDLEDAKEICQEAVIRIFRYLKSYGKQYSFKSWLYKVTLNATYDFLRGKKKEKEIFLRETTRLTEEPSGPEMRFQQSELREHVRSILSSLTPTERMVYILREEQGMETGDICRIAGCSGTSVRVHISRARKKIRGGLEKIYQPSRREQDDDV